MSEIALTHQPSPGAAPAGQAYLFFNPAGLPSFVGHDGRVRPLVPVVAELQDAAAIAVDAQLAHRAKFTVTLAGNRTLAHPTNLVDGARLSLVIRQDATGGRTLAYGSQYKFPGGLAPVLTAAAGSVDRLDALYDAAADVLLCQFTADVR